MRGGDKAPVASAAEARTRLMPDSHNVMCESQPRVVLALDGFSVKSGDICRGPERRPKLRRRLNLLPCGHTHRGRRLREPDLSVDLHQNEIGQGNQGRCDTACYQGVVGADAGCRLERWLAGFLHHSVSLGRSGQPFL